jgi:type II secretory pathway pseudopilin PulG
MRVTRTSERERAFTIVEVLIGALLVVAVLAGAMYFIAGSGKSQQKALVRTRMASAAQDISQRVRADGTWLKSHPECRTQSSCDVSDDFPAPTPRSGDPKLTSAVEISAIDSESDLRGRDDRDGVTPDYYRIHVTVSMPSAEQAKWGKQQPFEVTSTIDATAIGRATGSITLEICEVVNQVDERMSIAGCNDGGSGDVRRDMNKQPEPCSSPFPLGWNGWLNARPVLPLGCNDAFDSARSTHPYLAQVHLKPASGVGVTLTRETSDGGPGTTRSLADGYRSGASTYDFTGLPAGTYRINVTAGSGRQLWKTKTVPSALKTSVQANQEARTLVVVRPKQGVGTYKVKFSRAVWLYHLETFEDTDVYEEPIEQIPGAKVVTETHYVYLRGTRPDRQVWPGPAWHGIVSMEPKPFDRYRDDSDVVSQPTMLVAWAPKKAANDGVMTFSALPSGLHSLPSQQPKPNPLPAGELGQLFGSLGERSEHCSAGSTPGGSCGNFAWIDAHGDANGWVSWHSEDGECYLSSSVSGFSFGQRLQNGAGHGERCSRDLDYTNPKTGKRTNVPGFLPDKQGNGGKTIVLSMWQTTYCVGCPAPVAPVSSEASSPDPLEGGDNPSVATNGGTPPRTTAKPPVVTVKPPPSESNPSPAPVSLPAAGAVPAANGGGGGFG